MSVLRRTRIAFMVLVLGGLLAACDSSDPESRTLPEEVAGAYTFTQFEFDPDATVLPSFNVRDTLVASDTEIELVDSGQFLMTYRLRGGTKQLMTGTFTATRSQVRLHGSEADRAKFEALLLNENLVLVRDEADADVLFANLRATVDLAAFSDRYAGIGPVEGTLRLRLERE